MQWTGCQCQAGANFGDSLRPTQEGPVCQELQLRQNRRGSALIYESLIILKYAMKDDTKRSGSGEEVDLEILQALRIGPILQQFPVGVLQHFRFEVLHEC